MLQWLDTLIGLIVVLLAVSLVIMILTQIVVALLNLRGQKLMNGLKTLFENTHVDLKPIAKDISEAILSHPLISEKRIKLGQWKLATAITKDELLNSLQIIDGNFKTKVVEHLRSINNSVNQWFDSVMIRTSQSFVRTTRLWTVIFSIIVAFSFHLDFFDLFDQIYKDPEIRSKLVASSEALLNQAQEVVGTSSIVPAIYVDAISQLKSEDTTGFSEKLGVPPKTFMSRVDGENWIREQLVDSEKVGLLVRQYEAIVDTNVSNSLDILKDRAYSILGVLNNTGLKLIPQPYPGFLKYSINRHFFGVLIMVAFLSLGAPFWFNALKTLSALRPLLSSKEEKEQKERSKK